MDAEDTFTYVIPGGSQAGSTLTGVFALLSELRRIHGMQVGAPLLVTPTSRVAGSVEQAISSTTDATTVSRV